MAMATTLDEVWALFRETDRKFQDTDRKLQESRAETDREIKELAREAKEASHCVDLQIEKLGQKVDQVSDNLDKLGGKWGHFVENRMEIDVLVVNAGHVVAVEVKSSLSVADVNELMTDLARFRLFFPAYGDKQLYGAVAGMVIEEASDRYAYRQGLFVLVPMGENVRVLNDAKFQPKAW